MISCLTSYTLECTHPSVTMLYKRASSRHITLFDKTKPCDLVDAAMYQSESYKRGYRAQPKPMDPDPFQSLYTEPYGDQYWRAVVNGCEEKGSGEVRYL